MKSRSAWFENGTEKARKLKKENSKRLIKSAILGNADSKKDSQPTVFFAFWGGIFMFDFVDEKWVFSNTEMI